MVLLVPSLAQGCPVPAIGVAFGFDERTGATWEARAGRQGQAVHVPRVELPRDLGQVPADARRVKRQGGHLWMALAMMGKARLGTDKTQTIAIQRRNDENLLGS